MNRPSATFALILSIFCLVELCLSQSGYEYNEQGRNKRSPQMPPGMPPMPPGMPPMPPMPSFEEVHGARVERQAPPPPPPPSNRMVRQAPPPPPEGMSSMRIAREAPDSPQGPPSNRATRQAPPPPQEASSDGQQSNRFARQTKQTSSVLESFYTRSKREAKGRGTGSMPTKTG